jgi:hypothetical protein
MKMELRHLDAYGETLFHTIYIIYFSYKYHRERLAVQVYISES